MKQGLSTAQIVMLVVLAVVGLPIVGFILLIVAYAMMHNPPHHQTDGDAAPIDASATDVAPP